MVTELKRRYSATPQWTLADRLRKVRRDVANGMKQGPFAESLGLKAPTYAAWENGNNHPRDVHDLAARIEAVWGVPAWWVVDGDRLPRRDSNLEPSDYRTLFGARVRLLGVAA